jgi:hypothetical protein
MQQSPRDGQLPIKNMGSARPLHKACHLPRFLSAPPKKTAIVARRAKTDSGIEPRQMNAPSELNFEEMLRIRLEVLRREHRDLDDAIHALAGGGRADALTLQRLKRQKLALKDQIVRIEDQLIPDIIA